MKIQKYPDGAFDIFKDPYTDDGTKKSLKGLQMVYEDESGEIDVKSGCTVMEESKGLLIRRYEDGEFFDMPSLKELRKFVREDE